MVELNHIDDFKNLQQEYASFEQEKQRLNALNVSDQAVSSLQTRVQDIITSLKNFQVVVDLASECGHITERQIKPKEVKELCDKFSQLYQSLQSMPSNPARSQHVTTVPSPSFHPLSQAAHAPLEVGGNAASVHQQGQMGEPGWLRAEQLSSDLVDQAKNFLHTCAPKLTFVTGSNSACLVIMHLMKERGLAPALIPTGQLLEKNLVPLSGELSYGIQRFGVNRVALSGTALGKIEVCMNYAKDQDFIFDSDREMEYLLTVVTNKDLYQCIFHDPEDQNQDLQIQLRIQAFEAVRRITKERSEDSMLNAHNITILRVKVAILRLLITGQKQEDLFTVRWALEKIEADVFKELPETSYERKTLRELLKLFDEVKPIENFAQYQELVKNPIPIVWGSVTDKNNVRPLRQGVRGERIVEIPQELGKDVVIAFTDKEHVGKLGSLLEPFGVQVFDFDQAREVKDQAEERF